MRNARVAGAQREYEPGRKPSRRVALNLRESVFRGAMLLGLGECVVYGLSFARNIILARLLSRADLGIAATFSIVLTVFELSNKMAVGRLLVQDKEGATLGFMATAHALQFVAGLVSAILVFVAAAPLAHAFGLEGDLRAFQYLALLPLLQGATHLDISRMERDFRYLPSTLSGLLPQALITVLAWPLALWFGDYRAVLALLVVKSMLTLLATHILARRPYSWGWQQTYGIRMLRFSWPLVLNGLLMLGMFQGDQFIVASHYTMSDLAAFAMAGSLATAPSFIFARVFPSLMLPLMARVQDNVIEFQRLYQIVMQWVCIWSSACIVTSILGGEAIMLLFFGPKYAGTGYLLAWLAAANGVRTVRMAPAVAALAKADSQNQMLSNVWRVGALIPALLLASTRQPLWMIAATGVLGEAVACIVSLRRLRRRDSAPWSHSLGPAATVLLAASIGGLMVVWDFHQLPVVFGLAGAVFCGVACGLGGIALFAGCRRQVKQLWAAVWARKVKCFLRKVGKAASGAS